MYTYIIHTVYLYEIKSISAVITVVNQSISIFYNRDLYQNVNKISEVINNITFKSLKTRMIILTLYGLFFRTKVIV